jgi:hypothetical protein
MLAAGTGLAACSGFGGPAPVRPLAYDVPSPPAATYHVTDTTRMNIATPMGDMAVDTEMDVTVAMTFERAADGFRVTGSVEDFSGSMTNPLTGRQTTDADDLSGSLEYTVGRRGDVEVASLPELPAAAEQMSPFSSIARELFPPLPDAVVDPGGTWVDTVTWTTELSVGEITSNAVLTYTMVGDTLVDGRTLLHFTVAGEVSSDADVTQAGMAMTQRIAGSSSGFILWDADRGLPVYQESNRELEGTLEMVGMPPPLPMTAGGVTRVWLRN